MNFTIFHVSKPYRPPIFNTWQFNYPETRGGRVAMIMKAQNSFRNRAQVIKVGKQRLSG